LEETGFSYVAHRGERTLREQKKPEFLQLNPSGRTPVSVGITALILSNPDWAE